MAPRASVVVPAHNEEAVIGRCLRRLLADATPGEFEVIVACNGCTDRTADTARQAHPDATVLDITISSKPAALNAADEAASAFPRIYVDADVELDTDALRQLAAASESDDVLAAAPGARLELKDRPWLVRAYFRFSAQLPVRETFLAGAGVYALSQAGRSRFDRWPEPAAGLADDLFVSRLFTPTERRLVASAEVLVHPPRSMAGLIRRATRAYRLNQELSRVDARFRDTPSRPQTRDFVVRSLRTPGRRLDAAVFALTQLVIRTIVWASPEQAGGWLRDETSRD